MSTNETEKYIADAIHVWAWSGFYTEEDANEFLEDILEDGVDEDKMRELIAQEFAQKAEQEQSWPPQTDCDRLDAAFDALNRDLIIALQNAGYTTSDGHEDVGAVHRTKPPGTFRGYCFYHGQDLERAVNGSGLFLAFGDMKDTADGKTKVAGIITRTLSEHGFAVEWNGDVNQKIRIPQINWQRRLK